MKSLFILLSAINFCFCSCYGELEKLVILGGGPSGLTAAIFAGQAKLNPLVIEGEPSNGQYTAVYKIENFPGFPEGISGQDLNDKLTQQAQIFGTRFLCGEAVKVDLQSKPFHIELSNGTQIDTESLIIATGASPKWLELESEKDLIGTSISANAMADGPLFINKEVIVVGGGDSAMEQALILTEYASKVTLIYKGNTFFSSKYLQERVFANRKIECLYDTEVVKLLTTNQSINGVILRKKEKEFEIICEGIFVANGRKPNTDLFKGQLEMNKTGYIMTQTDSTKASIDGIFVAGDIAHNAYRKMVTAAASGCMAAIDAARYFANKKQ